MSGYEAVFIDMDGTLLRTDKSVSAETQRVLSHVADTGCHVVIATGRPPWSIGRYQHILPTGQPMLSLNGAFVHLPDTGQVVYHNPIPQALVADMVTTYDWLETAANVVYEVGTQYYVLKEDTFLEEFVRRHGLDPAGPLDHASTDVSKILVTAGDVDIDRYRDQLVQGHGTRVSMVKSLFDENGVYPLLEIMNAGVTKAEGVKYTLRHLGIESTERVLAIGDGSNDIEMLTAAGLGVAVANAASDVRQVADWVAPANDQDGVAATLRRFILEGTGKGRSERSA